MKTYTQTNTLESSPSTAYPHLCRAFGIYETNCYIVQTPQGDLIIDPGMDSTEWILQSISNPLAILITHGHFDHIFSVASLKEKLPHIPLYCPRDDSFMLESDCFDTGLTPYKLSENDVLVPCEKGRIDYAIKGICFSYIHFPGHTPGCSIICIGDNIYSGDFIFKRSIGRYDFPYSSATDMKESLKRFRELKLDSMDSATQADSAIQSSQSPSDTTNSSRDKARREYEIFPGHGTSTLLSHEQNNVELWISRI